jgi:hypothetical protein
MVLRPLDVSVPHTGDMDLLVGDCTAPMSGTVCDEDTANPPQATLYTNESSGVGSEICALSPAPRNQPPYLSPKVNGLVPRPAPWAPPRGTPLREKWLDRERISGENAHCVYKIPQSAGALVLSV